MRNLVTRWMDEAATLAGWGDERGAAVLRRVAQELDIAACEHDEEPLTITQASAESGFSADHLRSLVATGEIPNAGRRGSPRIRRRDLPMKPGARS